MKAAINEVAVLVAMAATAERPCDVQFVTSKDFKNASHSADGKHSDSSH